MEFFKNSRAMGVPAVRTQICILTQSLDTNDGSFHGLNKTGYIDV